MKQYRNIDSRKAVCGLSFATILIFAVAAYFIMPMFFQGFPLWMHVATALFFMVCFAVVLLPMTNRSERQMASGKIDDRKLLNRFMIYKTGKILAALIFAAVVLLNNRDIKIPFGVLFLTWYIVTLGLEVYAWSSMEKRIKAAKIQEVDGGING